MPSIRDSQNVRIHDDHTKAPRAPMEPQRPLGGLLPVGGDRSALMGSSLPVVAAGTDLYVRQFYGSGRLPQRRFLPVGL